MPLRTILLLLILAPLLWGGQGASALHAADGIFGVETAANVMVPMRDGVRLATDVYRPTSDGKPLTDRRPVILIRTPYNKGNGQSSEGKYFASHGYVTVIQDTRGRYRSEGVWHWLTDDGPDGVDCCAWIAEQPWSNGRIGMMGTSYVGGTQHAVAMAGSPHLKTVIPVDAVSNMGRQSMRNAGAFEMRFWNWIMLNAGKGSNAAQDPGTAAVLAEMADQRHDYLKLLPLRPGTTPLKLAPNTKRGSSRRCATGRTTPSGSRTTSSTIPSGTATFRSTWLAAGTTRGRATQPPTTWPSSRASRATCI
jgi:predicted acyl esterase